MNAERRGLAGLRRGLRASRELVGLSWSADPIRTVGAILLGLLNAVNNASGALWLKFVADGIARRDARLALIGGALITAWPAIFGLGTLWAMMVRSRVLMSATRLADQRLMEMSLRLPGLEHIERPDYLDRVKLLRTQLPEAVSASWSVFDGVMTAVQLVVTCSLLTTVHPSLVVLSLFALPMVRATMKSKMKLLRLSEQLAESERSEEYLFELATQPGPAKELRVFGLESEIERRRREIYGNITRFKLRSETTMRVKQAGGLLLFAAAYLGAIAFTAWRAVRGLATPGDVIMVLSAGGRLSGQMTGVISTGTTALGVVNGIRHYLWLTDYSAERISAAEAATEPIPQAVRRGITLRGVGFTYPGTTTPVLRDLQAEFPPGSVVALVGENGAGKTTLVKLLCRFYEPTHGRIDIDDVPLSSIAADEWRRHITTGFQDFGRFEFVLSHAVGVGDLTQVDSLESVAAAIGRAGADDVVSAVPGGLEGQLGRTFGGPDLSGGQWQKVALGRAMMRQAPLLFILDEPTAALDPAAEYHLFERYTERAKLLGARTGAVTMFVSHRFSTVRMADLIVVMAGGRIVEHGSHTELVRNDGLYAELYEIQSRSYR